MARVRVLLLSLAVIALGLDGGQAAWAQSTVRADSLTLEWRAAPADMTLSADGTLTPRVPGYALTAEPGQPRLPFASQLIVLPPGSQPTIEIVEIAQSIHVLPGPLALAPQPAARGLEGGGATSGGAFEPAEAVGAGPASPVMLSVLGVMRGVTLGRVAFYPVLPVGAELRITTFVRVRVHFNAVGQARALEAAPNGDDLLTALESQVANPDAVGASASAPPAMDQAALAAEPAALVEVGSAGLTAITYAALSAAGFPVGSVDPARLRLQRAGAEVLMEWEGDSDPAFEPGERFLFYAAPRFNRYTAHDVYRLSLGPAAAARMSSRAALSGVTDAGPAWAEVTFEANVLYSGSSCKCAPGRDGDRWFWRYLSQPGASTLSEPFSLSGLDSTQPATLTAWFVGYTKTAHHVDVTLNGTALGAAAWTGQLGYTFTVPVPANVLVAGGNSLALSLSGTDGLWLDAFQLRFAAGGVPAASEATVWGGDLPQRYTLPLASTLGARAYDLTLADQPVRLSGPDVSAAGVALSDPANSASPHRYLATAESAIHQPAAVRLPFALSGAAGADYLILAHPDFIPALSPLIALRQSQGLSVAVEDVRAVYDAGDGRPTADAIHSFLAQVYQTWSPRPAYVLLVGDGTYDPRRYRVDSQPTYLPPYLADVDPWLGETASDNRYAAVDGADTLPDFALGRLPVNSLAEAQAIVAKTVGYETAPPVGAWNSHAVFAADDADGAGDFPVLAEALTTAIQAPRLPERIYYSASASLTDTRQAIGYAWNRGASVIVYNGHASPRQWGAEPFFHMDSPDYPNAVGLVNGGRLPILLEMTCLTGSFQDAARSTLDEALVRNPVGGAVGAWGPTGLGLATGHDTLGQAFLSHIYTAGGAKVGEAIFAAQAALAATGQNLDLIDTYTWLGDPALSVQLPVIPGTSLYLPVIRR